uniref:Uncharacterized protein n=1 Tax=Glossina austeni TaxID=7395 RepID=A0A1A9UHA9_GLOAU
MLKNNKIDVNVLVAIRRWMEVDGGAIFLQIKNGFAQMEAKYTSSLENSLMNLEKKIRNLVLEQHNRGLQEISEMRAELFKQNEPVGAKIAGARNDMSAGQLTMQQDLKDMKAKLF